MPEARQGLKELKPLGFLSFEEADEPHVDVLEMLEVGILQDAAHLFAPRWRHPDALDAKPATDEVSLRILFLPFVAVAEDACGSVSLVHFCYHRLVGHIGSQEDCVLHD